MKKIVLLFTITLMLFSCNKGQVKERTKWEYKIVKIDGETTQYQDFGGCDFNDPTQQLNSLGAEGWEVVSSYTEVETVHPNYGDPKYVTGIQPNTRTTVVTIILKREKREKQEKNA